MAIADSILLIVAAYLAGSIPTAYLVAKWRRGIDIRQYGSGNVGASNISVIVSRRWGLFVSAVDVLKGAIPVLVAKWLGLGVVAEVAVGLAAISGHNWSIFLKFSGGRGIYTSIGVILTLSPIASLIAIAIALAFAPFHHLPLGVLIGLIVLAFLSWFGSPTLGVAERLPLTVGFVCVLLVAVIRRLTVSRTQLSASTPTGELIINRLLFDRDIRDRKAWIRQTPNKPE